MSSNSKWNMFIAAFIILLIFLPAIFLTFAFQNDYWRFFYSGHDFFYPESLGMSCLGRPLNAFFLNIQYMFIHNISDFSISRLVSISIIIINFLLLYSILTKKIKVYSLLATLIAFSIFLLPSSQLSVIHAGQLTPGCINVMFVLLAYMIVHSVPSCNFFKKICVQFAGYSLWFATLFIYPPTSYFYFVPVFASLLFANESKWKFKRKKLIKETIIIITLSMVYFIFVKYYIYNLSFAVFQLITPLFPTASPVWEVRLPDFYSISIYTDINAKLFLIKSIIFEHSGLWFGHFFKHSWIVFWLPVLLFGFIKFTIDLSSQNYFKIKFFIEKIILGIGIWFICISPMLISAHNANIPEFMLVFGAYRVMFAAVSIGAIMLIVVFWELGKLIPVYKIHKLPAISLVTIATFFAAYSIFIACLGLNREFTFMINKLSSINLSKLKNLMIILPPQHTNSTLVDSQILRLDQTFMASNSGVTDFPRQILRELGVPKEQLDKITIVMLPSNNPNYIIKQPDNTESVLIDLNTAGYYPHPPWKSYYSLYLEQKLKNKIEVSYSPLFFTPNFSPLNLFDDNINTAWEPLGKAPFIITLNYRERQLITNYSVTSHDIPSRMPENWEVYCFSENNNTWELTDSQNRQTDWEKNETRSFKIKHLVECKQIKILFSPSQSNPGILRISGIKFW